MRKYISFRGRRSGFTTIILAVIASLLAGWLLRWWYNRAGFAFFRPVLARLWARWRSVFRQKPARFKQLPPITFSDSLPVSCVCLYNGYPERLEEAIYSFLQQDHRGPKELIIVNDNPAQTLVFDHPEVRIINLPQAVYYRRKWNMAVAACRHALIFAWSPDDISLPHRISVSLKKMAEAGNLPHFTPATIFIWENERVSGPYHNLFYQGGCWSGALFNHVKGLKRTGIERAIVGPRLKTINPPRDNSLSPEETFYIFKGLVYATAMPVELSGEISLKPRWRADYSTLVQNYLAGAPAADIDLSLPELTAQKLRQLARRGDSERRRYYVFEDRRLAYISTAKVACTSIKSVMMHPYGVYENVHSAWPYIYKGRLMAEHQDFFTFSFVRNPFDRLVSAYRNKIFGPRHQREEFGDIHSNISFSEFVAEVVKRPDCLINGHFQSQYSKLYRNGELLVDYLGRFENLAEDWLTIANHFDFERQLPHKMRSTHKKNVHKDYRAYYTEALVQLVYNRYRADVEAFGYQEAYEALLAFVREREDVSDQETV
jgi:chondroitin 4-sulfotransferase 11